MQQLVETLYGHSGLGGKSVYQVLYDLWALGENGVNPGESLATAATRSGHTMPDALRLQLLVDWRIASENGLLTSGNLNLMRRNLPPSATTGRYVGQRFSVILINQGGAFEIANMMLAVAGMESLPGAVADPNYTPPHPGFTPSLPPPTFYNNVGGLPPGQRVANRLPNGPWQPPSPAVGLTTPTGTAAGAGPHIAVVDLPMNGVLPLDGHLKLGVVRVTGSEIEASLIGEGQVSAGAVGGSRGQSLPTVHAFKVPKTNPVRLPGIDANAYLILNQPSMQFYYVDVTVNNGGSFRVACVLSAR